MIPFDWPAQAVQLNSEGCALVLLTLPADSNRLTAREYVRRALRQLLGDLLQQAAEAVVLCESAYGPILEGSEHKIHISLSYAADRCLIGLSTKYALGVDIVKIDSIPEITALSRLYLPSIDYHALLAETASARNDCFALAWAKMEARSKCLGLPLDEISQQREQALNTCKLVDCVQRDPYRIALAIAPWNDQNSAGRHSLIPATSD